MLARSHRALGEALRAVGRGSEADGHLARASELDRELRRDGPAVTAVV
ncbi:hypothetical protein [Streptomyces sp. BHT-5-2]|nr:hypothetical protein [Streptomyces sp. BHT-5-2]